MRRAIASDQRVRSCHARMHLRRSSLTNFCLPSPSSPSSSSTLVARAGDGRATERYHPQTNRLAGSTAPGVGGSSSNPVLDRLAYGYFNWRKNTISDLVLFAILNVLFVVLVSVAAQALRFGDALSLWAILQIVVGQELPEESRVSLAEQVFAFGVGIVGLSSFAIVLALVEQAVLEVLEANVRLGSNVIEEGHVVLLSWGTSNRDLAQTIRIVKEICASQQYAWIKDDGQLSVVVLSQGREKLEMESIFDGALPESQRSRCRLVFRKGSPLDPLALDMVSVATAKTVIISGDYSARCRESDARVLPQRDPGGRAPPGEEWGRRGTRGALERAGSRWSWSCRRGRGSSCAMTRVHPSFELSPRRPSMRCAPPGCCGTRRRAWYRTPCSTTTRRASSAYVPTRMSASGA